MADATRKVESFPQLKIVGITGSYGKSTTKEILYLILKDRFNTIKTENNINSDIGVALTVLEKVTKETEVFVVEMGAYTKGDIRAICSITPPAISVLTGITEQHLGLFGSLENILRAKYEIVEYAKDDATVILNADNDMVLQIAGKSQKKEILYSASKELDLRADSVELTKSGISFMVHYKTEQQTFEVSILGQHNISNVLAAVGAALTLGMDLATIARLLKKNSKHHPVGKLSIKKSNFGFTVIDDSYNSNPVGFEAALIFLHKFKGNQKVVVTQGIVDIGEHKENIYARLSKMVVQNADMLITSDKTLYDSVKKESRKFETVVADNDLQLAILKQRVKKGDVVLLEGANYFLNEKIINERRYGADSS